MHLESDLIPVARALDGGPRWVAPEHPFTAAELASAPDEVAFIVTTSGSTGTAKGVLLSAEAVRASAAATREVIGDGAWALALPTRFIAGLMVLTRAILSDQPVVPVASDLSDLAPTGPTHLSIVPTQLVRALADPERTARLADCASVLLGGAPAAPEVLERARDAGIRVITTYGMSETSGGCIYDGIPLPGVEVNIGAADRVELSGPMVFSGYLGRPDLTAETLRTDPQGRRTIRTQDRGRLSNGRLTILGRADDVVISGGVNVDLAEVSRAAHHLPGEHIAFGVDDAEWGTRVVLATTGTSSLTEIRQRLAGALPAPALPRGRMQLDSLPLTDRGKIDRASLPSLWQRIEQREVY